MKVILTTKIKKLGKIGDLISVKDGYARNFLFPNKMALRENKKNIEYYNKIKTEMQKKENIKKEESEKIIKAILKLDLTFNKEADEKGQLYGSISKKEIMEYFSQNNINLNSDDIIIRNQIKTIGEHTIEINPYMDINENIKINVSKN